MWDKFSDILRIVLFWFLFINLRLRRQWFGAAAPTGKKNVLYKRSTQKTPIYVCGLKRAARLPEFLFIFITKQYLLGDVMSLKLIIPGRKRQRIKLTKLVLDLNGTLAVDGIINKNTLFLLKKVAAFLEVHILTADTLGSAVKLSRLLKENIQKINIQVVGNRYTSTAKAYYIQSLGPREVMAVGNGANDAAMLKESAVGIAVLGPEGCAVEALRSADLVVKDIDDALYTIIKPRRLIAALRN